MNSCEFTFVKKKHVAFMRRSLSILPQLAVSFDTSRMTVLFFALSGLDILGALSEIPDQEKEEIVDWIYSLQLSSKDGFEYGGFRGGHCTTKLEIGSNGLEFNQLKDVDIQSKPHTNCFSSEQHVIPKKLMKVYSHSDTSSDMNHKNFNGDHSVAKLNSESILLNDYQISRNSQAASIYDTGHIAMTYTALASLVLLGDDLSRVDKVSVLKHVASLQCNDGSFQSNNGGSEKDLRFVYCAAAVCHILGDWNAINISSASDYIRQCLSYGGALGQGYLQESHGGSTYCGVAALHLMGCLAPNKNILQQSEIDNLVRWLLMRQQSLVHQDEDSRGGGLQGRPNKPSDTCYTFWIGATLKLLDRHDLLEDYALQQFVMSTQDPIRGGFGKTQSSGPDGLHSYLGLSGLALLQLQDDLLEIDPALNITVRARNYLQSLRMNERE